MAGERIVLLSMTLHYQSRGQCVEAGYVSEGSAAQGSTYKCAMLF